MLEACLFFMLITTYRGNYYVVRPLIRNLDLENERALKKLVSFNFL